MASLNPFRRKRTVLVASATNIELGTSDIVESVLKRRQEWQTRAIDVTEVVGEIGFGVNENSDLLAQIPIFAAELPSNQEDRPTRTDNAAAKQAIEDLGNFTQRAELQRQLALHLQVTGEAFLVGIQPGPDRPNTELLWDIAGIAEVSVIDIAGADGPIKTIKLEGWTDEGKDLILDPRTSPPDVFIRIWRPSLRRKQLATSHVRSVLGASEELLWWDAASVAAAKNRMTMAGLWGIPSNIELPAENEQDARFSGSQRFINRILKSMMIAISNPAAAEAAAPILFTYPWNESAKSGIELIEPTRPRDELLEKRTDRCLLRIAQGLNLPMEVISGEGGATHWGAGQIEEAQFRKHVQPLAVLLVNALTIAYLHPVLRAQNVDPSKYVIWFDASSLIVNQNKTRDVIRAYELGEANGDALRREIGLTEGDKPTPEERAQTIEFLQALKGANNDREGVIPDPKKSPEQDMKDPNAVPERNTPGSRTPVEQPAAPLKGKGQSPITSAASVLNGHTDELLLAMQVTCDEKVRAALTKAGSRLRSRANKVPAYKELVFGLPSEAIAATLGREAVIKLGINTLFDDCFNAVHSRLVFHASAHLPITTDFSSATTYLVTQLRNIAAERLFDPPTDDYLVPISVISDSIRRLSPAPVPT